MKQSHTYTLLLGTACVTLLLLGCDQAKPVTYEIPKEERSVTVPGMTSQTNEGASRAAETGKNMVNSSASGMQVLPGMADAAKDAGEIAYTTPDDWTEKPPTGIRKANFTVESSTGSAEVTVLVFPGDVGGNLANINRWRGQIGMQPATEESLSQFTEPYAIAKHGGLLVKLLGSEQAIIGGLLPFHGFTWFFKMQGDLATVAEQEANMRRFLDSVEMKGHTH